MDLNFAPGTQVRITRGAYARQTGVIDSHIFGPSFDFRMILPLATACNSMTVIGFWSGTTRSG